MKPVTACQTLLKNELPEDAAAACCSMGASGLAGELWVREQKWVD